jgi:hypothetical protein
VKESTVPDERVLGEIERLVTQEHGLFKRAEEEGGLSDEEQSRLQELTVHLDQCWDLLRQRRALRDAGQNPDDAQVRSPKTVEGYLS